MSYVFYLALEQGDASVIAQHRWERVEGIPADQLRPWTARHRLQELLVDVT
jgi:hypothetical protein